MKDVKGDYFSKAEEPSLPYNLILARERWKKIHAFSKGKVKTI